jgi:hypothetical protein
VTSETGVVMGLLPATKYGNQPVIFFDERRKVILTEFLGQFFRFKSKKSTFCSDLN